MPKSRLTKADIVEMERLYKGWIPVPEIAKRFGFGKDLSMVYYHLGITKRSKKVKRKTLKDTLRVERFPSFINEPRVHRKFDLKKGKSYIQILKDDANRRGVPFKKPKHDSYWGT